MLIELIGQVEEAEEEDLEDAAVKEVLLKDMKIVKEK